jgi:hypothetical protein
MVTLNLLPDAVKKKIRLKHRYEAVSRSLIFICVLLIIISGSFYGYLALLKRSNYSFYNYINSEELDKNRERIFQYQDSATKIGVRINWSQYLKAIFNNNQNIIITDIKCQTSGMNCQIDGQAKTREDLDRYEDSFSQQKIFFSLKESKKNIFAVANFPFSIEITAKK